MQTASIKIKSKDSDEDWKTTEQLTDAYVANKELSFSQTELIDSVLIIPLTTTDNSDIFNLRIQILGCFTTFSK